MMPANNNGTSNITSTGAGASASASGSEKVACAVDTLLATPPRNSSSSISASSAAGFVRGAFPQGGGVPPPSPLAKLMRRSDLRKNPLYTTASSSTSTSDLNSIETMNTRKPTSTTTTTTTTTAAAAAAAKTRVANATIGSRRPTSGGYSNVEPPAKRQLLATSTSSIQQKQRSQATVSRPAPGPIRNQYGSASSSSAAAAAAAAAATAATGSRVSSAAAAAQRGGFATVRAGSAGRLGVGKATISTRFVPTETSATASAKSTVARPAPSSVSDSGMGAFKDPLRNAMDARKKLSLVGRKMSTTTLLSTQRVQEIEKLKSEAQDLQEKIADLQTQLEETSQAKASLETEVEQLKDTLTTSGRQHVEEVDALKRESLRVLGEHAQQISLLNMEKSNLKMQLDSTVVMLTSANERIHKLTLETNNMKSSLEGSETTSMMLESQLRAEKLKVEVRNTKIEELENLVKTLTSSSADLEKRVFVGEKLRRKLHNEILELKGNIRVFCRVRPLLPKEPKVELHHLRISEDTSTIEVFEERDSADKQRTISKSFPFTFDKVFGVDTKQGYIFEEISQLVQSALDGYNVCIFAYGQTGSGKTYTMEGNTHDPEHLGMIPRAVAQVFEGAEELRSKGWEFKVEAQFLEIYNEQVRDLLAASGYTTTEPFSLSSKEQKIEIRHIPNTSKTVVTEVVLQRLSSSREALDLLHRAARNRAVGATSINERSSRSHSVFTLMLTGKNHSTDEVIEGRVNLVDLAGSERLAQSHATGDRLRETQNINRSLSCLGDVIQALANKDQHVPYRNSKLTYLLQNSLGGNSKTLMFVNVSPLPSTANETLNSLRFAAKVNSCHIGTARRQTIQSLSNQ